MLAASKVALIVLLRCMAAELMAERMEELADLIVDLIAVQLTVLVVVDLKAKLSSFRTANQ